MPSSGLKVLIVNLAGVLLEDWHRQVVIPSAHDK